MTYSSYERQHLALYAAGFISGDGNTRVGFGCEMTRVGTGVYAAVFGADAGLVNDESFSVATVKSSAGSSGSPRTFITVEDTSNLVKTIFAQNLTQVINTDLEIQIYRSVTRI